MHDDGRRADCGGDAFRTSTGASTGHRDSRRARGPIKAGFFTDLIVIPGNPLDEVDALKNVQFVMKDGQVFKKGGVMTPAAFFHGGPVDEWRIR